MIPVTQPDKHIDHDPGQDPAKDKVLPLTNLEQAEANPSDRHAKAIRDNTQSAPRKHGNAKLDKTIRLRGASSSDPEHKNPSQFR